MSRRRPPLSLDMPGAGQSRRTFLVRGLTGGMLLALGGAGWLLTRKTRLPPELLGPLRVFSPEEGAVLAAVAERLVPERTGFPRPGVLRLASRMDEVAAMAHPATQVELRRLVRLFESALAGLLLDGQARLFTTSTPAQQDRRLGAWAQSRLPLRRTGYRALKRLVYASYYAAPETWAAIGYAGPPLEIPAGGGVGR